MFRRGSVVVLAVVVGMTGLSGSLAWGSSHTPICEIQGSGFESPLVGETVTTRGLLYARRGRVLYLQDVGCDADPQTSDGIIVFNGTSVFPSLGDMISATGEVVEFFGATEVDADSLTIESSGNPLPAPVTLNPDGPFQGAAYLEALEAMRVAVERAQTYVGTNRFGESFLVLLADGESLTDRIRRTDTVPEPLALDDGIDFSEKPAFAFDEVRGGVGPLDFTFNNYKVMIEDWDDVAIAGPGDRPHPITAQPADTLDVATWNLFNVFDEIPDNTPDTETIEVISPADQAVKRQKIAHGVVDELGAPAAIAVQEVENKPLLDAVAADLDAYAASQGLSTDYVAYLEEGNDPRGIDVGFLVDSKALEVTEVRQIGKEALSDGRCTAGVTGDRIYDRVPLLIEVKALNGQSFKLVSNHFKSKFGGTPEDDFFEDCRVEQAEFLRDHLRTEAQRQDRIIMMGDFNAFRDSKTLEALTQGNFANTVNGIPEDRRFSFVFEGRVQFLDHIVVSSAVKVAAVDSSKLDSDVPIPQYEDDPSTGWATSDHDPLVAYLTLVPRQPGPGS